MEELASVAVTSFILLWRFFCVRDISSAVEKMVLERVFSHFVL